MPREQSLVNEIHAAIHSFYDDNLIQHLHSCLKELITSALNRFRALNLLESRSYPTHDGTYYTFLSSPFERKENIE